MVIGITIGPLRDHQGRSTKKMMMTVMIMRAMGHMDRQRNQAKNLAKNLAKSLAKNLAKNQGKAEAEQGKAEVAQAKVEVKVEAAKVLDLDGGVEAREVAARGAERVAARVAAGVLAAGVAAGVVAGAAVKAAKERVALVGVARGTGVDLGTIVVMETGRRIHS